MNDPTLGLWSLSIGNDVTRKSFKAHLLWPFEYFYHLNLLHLPNPLIIVPFITTLPT